MFFVYFFMVSLDPFQNFQVQDQSNKIGLQLNQRLKENFYYIFLIAVERMGCEPSQVVRTGHQIKISIVDSSFMKAENEDIRNQMHAQNIAFEYFISQQCFFEEFAKRYYNRVVTSLDGYAQLKAKLQKMGLTPNIFVLLDGRTLEEETPFNVTILQNYRQLIPYLRQHACPSIIPNSFSAIKSMKKKVHVKILCKPGPKNSEQTIFEAALKKSNISYQFFTSFQLLEQSVLQSESQFVVTDYVFHREVIELLADTKIKVICFCTFDKNETYHSGVYSLSNNYLDITSDIKYELRSQQKNTVKCSKVYLYSHGLNEDEQVKSTLEQFDIQVRQFTNMEKVIKQTTYFFCVTVICADVEAKNLAKYFQRNDYLQRVKILGIPKGTQATVKGLFKLIRNIKKGYKVKKSITNSIDIIDKHYNSTKFEQIKKQLQSNDIKCFGFGNLSEYIKNKKFISPFIICNYEERSLLVKYMKQLQCKAKLIVFCNKNKINHEIKDNKSFSFVSSHFGKIIKFIKKTHVFIPPIDKQDQLLFKEKIDKIKTKNKRISALKWSRIDGNESQQTNQDNFQFLNIAKGTNQGSIKDIQKTIATIWKVDCSIFQIQNFKKQFINSLGELRKIHKINFQETQFNQMIQKLKGNSVSQLLEKVKSFFDADNELGLQINKSLMKTESLQKKQITNMRQFLLLVFLNFFSGYQMPRIGRKKLCHWISNSLIQKCEIGSYLFSKHFVIFYEQNASKLNQIGKFKIQLNIDYNSLSEGQLLLNSFISYKDKIIFSPFSQFQIERIVDTGEYKVITVKYVKNIDFLKYIYQDNLFKQGQSMNQFVALIENSDTPFLDPSSKQKVISNLSRVRAIDMFQKGAVTEAIEIHKRLIKQNEQKQNLDSALIDQLNFELACFYFKAGMNRQAGAAIKQLLQADPGEYIKQECQKMIKQVFEIDQSDEKTQQKKQKKRRISEEAMKTFVWLKNKEEKSEDSFRSQDEQENDDQGVVFENELKCIQIEDIDPIQEIASRKDIGKQNVD